MGFLTVIVTEEWPDCPVCGRRMTAYLLGPWFCSDRQCAAEQATEEISRRALAELDAEGWPSERAAKDSSCP